MKTKDAIKIIDSKEFIDMIYNFAYRRCNTSFDAQDLTSDIIFAILTAVKKQKKIENFYAFIWTIAHRVYADFCDRRSKKTKVVYLENCCVFEDEKLNVEKNFIDSEQLDSILKEIAFLSKAYREVMVMYYVDEFKVGEIAEKLGLNETAVKQRLFSARNTVKNEVENMKTRNLILKPVRLIPLGTGRPIGNDPATKTERDLSQALVYICKDKPQTAKQLSETLCIPTPYIEEELEIQCKGENGEYGTLCKLDNGKYTINVPVVDYEEYDAANKIFEKRMPEIIKILKETTEEYKEKIMGYNYLSKQDDIGFVFWDMIKPIVTKFSATINKILKEKYFADVVIPERPYSCVNVAYNTDMSYSDLNMGFYGWDGTSSVNLCGYSRVELWNLYGKRMQRHFYCGHNISIDAQILMTIRSVGGLDVETLNEVEKEVVAKAIESGYIRKNGNLVEPKIVTLEKEEYNKFFNELPEILNKKISTIIEEIAAELAHFIKKHLPNHLIGEYECYTQLIAGARISNEIIEECLKEGLLSEPEETRKAEGVMLIIEK